MSMMLQKKLHLLQQRNQKVVPIIKSPEDEVKEVENTAIEAMNEDETSNASIAKESTQDSSTNNDPIAPEKENITEAKATEEKQKLEAGQGPAVRADYPNPAKARRRSSAPDQETEKRTRSPVRNIRKRRSYSSSDSSSPEVPVLETRSPYRDTSRVPLGDPANTHQSEARVLLEEGPRDRLLHHGDRDDPHLRGEDPSDR
ncbi:hypothetical protein JTE90_023638 [Oedothorax gibbosus]|uniref:Shugoshin C-terminal domain-containing protein n=1 Tax=Oedothorax gibbosus TaxID=931172 RepID=A0AAV6TNQ7_9ARAC|nr:hypothetical protein JTE90_023638 [Oedothorax gibbosus]